MDEKTQDVPEFDLEDILKEFGSEGTDAEIPVSEGSLDDTESPEEKTLESPVFPEEDTDSHEVPEDAMPQSEESESPDTSTEGDPPEEPEAESAVPAEDTEVTRDTIRLDTLSQMIGREESSENGQSPAQPEDETEQPPEEPLPPPIPFRSRRTRLRELKRKLIAGPEKRYYELAEIGLGKLQMAILLNIIIVLICVAATAMHACGIVPDNRIRLLVFSQVLAMLVSALLGAYCLWEGLLDLFRGKFSMNTLLAVTFVSCCADAVFALKDQRVPCCAAFCLSITMALWSRYQQRNTEMGEMDTLRKAVRLESLVKVDNFYEGQSGIIRGEGQVEHFMDNYDVLSGPEKIQRWFAFIAFLLCIGIAVTAGVLHGSLSLAIQIFSTSLLVAVPASFFVALSRPKGVLERRLHMVGTVLCGWQGVKGLCAKATFPLSDKDLFPLDAVKLNGVKFYGERGTDEIVEYATALIRVGGGGLTPAFEKLLKSRGGREFTPESFRDHGTGGIGGEVRGESVLLGTPNFLQDMGVEIPDGSMVSQAVYCAIDGQLCAVFAISYGKMKSSAAGLVTLCGCRRLNPVITCGDFMVTESFLRSKFGVNTRRISFPDKQIRHELEQRRAAETDVALAMMTRDGLTSAAYAVAGARALRTASIMGLIVHMLGGILGMLIMLALAYLGSVELLTPVNVLLYQLVWLVPGLLFTEWTRTV